MKWATIIVLLAICSCQDRPAPAEATEEPPPIADDAGTPAERPDRPARGRDAGREPMGMFGRPDGPILPLMPEEEVQVAIDLVNEELEGTGLGPAELVPVHRGTLDEVSFYAGEEALGWTPGRVILLVEGELCESPMDYRGRLVLWVLCHELLHTVGLDHGPELARLANGLGRRSSDYCSAIEDDAGI